MLLYNMKLELKLFNKSNSNKYSSNTDVKAGDQNDT